MILNIDRQAQIELFDIDADCDRFMDKNQESWKQMQHRHTVNAMEQKKAKQDYEKQLRLEGSDHD